MKEIEKGLDKVAGGKAVESKDGKFFVVADDALMFDTEAEANAADKMRIHLMNKMHKHGGMHGGMHGGCHKNFDKPNKDAVPAVGQEDNQQ